MRTRGMTTAARRAGDVSRKSLASPRRRPVLLESHICTYSMCSGDRAIGRRGWSRGSGGARSTRLSFTTDFSVGQNQNTESESHLSRKRTSIAYLGRERTAGPSDLLWAHDRHIAPCPAFWPYCILGNLCQWLGPLRAGLGGIHRVFTVPVAPRMEAKRAFRNETHCPRSAGARDRANASQHCALASRRRPHSGAAGLR